MRDPSRSRYRLSLDSYTQVPDSRSGQLAWRACLNISLTPQAQCVDDTGCCDTPLSKLDLYVGKGRRRGGGGREG